jgi:exodeoxyribonuclease V alpha subunit
VTQLRNDYDKKVFNGSVGVVTGLSLEEQELRVFMDETEEVVYSFDELDEITHAYAVTVHRSQGSEYPCVVLPLSTSAWLMLRRNLLYTAVTRAKRLVVLVGSKRAMRLRLIPGRCPRWTTGSRTLPPTSCMMPTPASRRSLVRLAL